MWHPPLPGVLNGLCDWEKQHSLRFNKFFSFLSEAASSKERHFHQPINASWIFCIATFCLPVRASSSALIKQHFHPVSLICTRGSLHSHFSAILFPWTPLMSPAEAAYSRTWIFHQVLHLHFWERGKGGMNTKLLLYFHFKGYLGCFKGFLCHREIMFFENTLKKMKGRKWLCAERIPPRPTRAVLGSGDFGVLRGLNHPVGFDWCLQAPHLCNYI